MNILYVSLSVLLIGYVSAAGNASTEAPVTTQQPTTQPPTAPTTQPTTQKPTTQPKPDPVVTTQKPVSTTEPLSPQEECAARNGSCKECLGLAQCLWCNSDKSCKLYPAGDVLPHSDLCALDAARWGVCWVNFKVLIIVMASLGGVIFLAITVCICCCCCRKKSSSSFDREDAKLESKKMERKAKNDEKRSDRKKRTDEIRRKYGLIKDDNQYQRFDEA